MLTPLDFGLPAKFSEWRPGQLDTIERGYNSQSRFVGICAPTGFGKSLAYMALGRMSGWRTLVLTSTKGLQDQLATDFKEVCRDIRGQNNYRCRPEVALSCGYSQFTPVGDAPCNQEKYACNYRGGGCVYYDDYRLAQAADIVVSNYQCWFYDLLRQDKLDSERPFDLLVLDEAHDAPEELASFLGIEVDRKECSRLQVDFPIGKHYTLEQWKDWGNQWTAKATSKIEDNSDRKEVKLWREILRKVGKVARITKEDWIVEEKPESQYQKVATVQFDSLWPKRYAESVLFRGIKRVVLVSATMRPKTAELLGVSTNPTQASGLKAPTNPATMDFMECGSTFPVHSRPVIHVPTVQMNHRTSDSQIRWWLERIDQIIEKRSDRKGIIHTVSYKRARQIYEHSRHSSRMLVHGSDTARTTIEQFKTSSKPYILVSPSVSTGYDFPYEQCEFQIIGKLPFPDGRSEVIKARMKQDSDYTNYICAQNLVQSVGRGMRAPDDRCETLIIDDSIGWFVSRNKHLMPRWFTSSVTKSEIIPEPLPKLVR